MRFRFRCGTTWYEGTDAAVSLALLSQIEPAAKIARINLRERIAAAQRKGAMNAIPLGNQDRRDVVRRDRRE